VRDLSLLERLALAPADRQADILRLLPSGKRRRVLTDWRMQARPSQLPPPGDWSVWLILAGRGFGKTRTGAAWVQQQARRQAGVRIALVGATAHDVASVMVTGESGICPTSPPEYLPRFLPSKRMLLWPNGSLAMLFSAVEPNRLRGPQFHFAWCDEIAAWQRPQEAWDNLRMGLRLGERPRVLVTTTPRPTRFLAALMAGRDVAVTRGATHANRANLPPSFLRDMDAAYAGSALGRQELLGEIIDSKPGALWSRAMLDGCRVSEVPELRRVVVGVDPPAGPGTCGIVAAGLAPDGRAYVLADASLSGGTPAEWASAVVAVARRHEADRVVAEINQGGAMVENILRAAEANIPLTTVRASRGKAARAEPIAALYAAGRVCHAAAFEALEDEMCGLIQGGGYEGPGSSPDRADALVWALTYLLLGPSPSEPAFRLL
jgi:phage terminase large subunit-like protein